MTRDSLKPRQAIFLYSLFFSSDGISYSDAKKLYNINGDDRKTLLDMGLIRTVKEGSATSIYLKDHAWDWGAENLTLPLLNPGGNPSRACGLLAETILAKLQQHIQEGTLTLAEFVSPLKGPHEETETYLGENPEEVILFACRMLMLEKSSDTVFLKDLRKRLHSIPREDMDSHLLALQKKGVILLMTYQDPLGRKEEDDAAALRLGDVHRHILRFP